MTTSMLLREEYEGLTLNKCAASRDRRRHRDGR